MGKLNGKDATVWLRAIRDHTYEGRPVSPGDCYLAHEEMVETIVESLKFAVRDDPPVKLERPREYAQAERLPAKPGTADGPVDPNMQPWPTPSATSARSRRRPRKA